MSMKKETRRAKVISIVTECPNCGNKLTIRISKKQAKEIYKRFKGYII